MLIFLLLLPFLHAQPLSSPIPIPLESLSVLSAALKSDKSLLPPLRSIHALFTTVSNVSDTRFTSSDPQACNLRAVPWLTSVADHASAHALDPPERLCASHIHASDVLMERDLPILKSAGEVMKRFADVSSKVAKGVAWSGETERMAGWVVSRGGQRCALESVMGVRSKGRWYVRLRATNKNVNVYVANGGRMYVAEFVDVEGRALQMVLNETEVTTFMETRGGRGEFGVGDMAEDDNPALTEAERLNEIAVDQASDAITPSNIAILALPMVMSLIPVAFLADLNTCATLMYILVTDVFASLPFMIKGVELMASGTVRRGETVAYHVGSVTDSVMEVWSAECSGDESFRVLGLVFICVAASVIILGVLLEALAWRKMRGGQQPVEEGPFGEIFFPDGIVGRDDEWLEEPGEDRFDRTGWRRRRWRRDAEYEGFG